MKKKVYKIKKIRSSRDILLKLENVGSPHVKGEKYLHETLSELKKIKKRGAISGILEGIEKLSPGARLLQNVRSGRVVYVSGRISHRASLYYAVKWLYIAANQKSHKISIGESLASDIEDSFYNKGMPFKYKNELFQGILASRSIKKKSGKKHTGRRRDVKSTKSHRLKRGISRVKPIVKSKKVNVNKRIKKSGKYFKMRRVRKEAIKEKYQFLRKRKRNFKNEKEKKEKKEFIQLYRMLGNPILKEYIVKVDESKMITQKLAESFMKLIYKKLWKNGKNIKYTK